MTILCELGNVWIENPDVAQFILDGVHMHCAPNACSWRVCSSCEQNKISAELFSGMNALYIMKSFAPYDFADQSVGKQTRRNVFHLAMIFFYYPEQE